MSIHLALLLGYSALLVALGLFIGRRVSGTNDFFVAGRRLGPGLLFSTMLAANIGGGSRVGATGLGYRDGLAAFWWVGSAAVGSLLLALWIGPAIRRIAAAHELKTVGDFLELRYGRHLRAIVSVLVCLVSLAIPPGRRRLSRAARAGVHRLARPAAEDLRRARRSRGAARRRAERRRPAAVRSGAGPDGADRARAVPGSAEPRARAADGADARRSAARRQPRPRGGLLGRDQRRRRGALHADDVAVAGFVQAVSRSVGDRRAAARGRARRGDRVRRGGGGDRDRVADDHRR